ncbi:unnamed protein product [Symbiodinium necroappetens]|uniref:Uncharacterized protein n=1 Tax=Symbiodinium necroappetens TaxID=1628268 RepID=A0A812T1S3_9DINO|nr:unnamed protein product [Symbiodinium necroappetens]
MSGPTLQREIAAVEQALSTEIRRRSDLEARLAATVDAEVRKAVREAAGAIEAQLSSGYRRHVDDMSTRLLVAERSLGALRTRLETEVGRKELGAKSVSEVSDRHISWLEARVTELELKGHDTLPMEVARQLQLMRQQLLDEAASRWADVAGPLQVGTAENRQRVDALEQWLREALAPELVRLQLDLASEHRCRERLESVVNKQLALSKTLERARAVSVSPRLSHAPQAAPEPPSKPTTRTITVSTAPPVAAPRTQASSEGLPVSTVEIVPAEPLPAGGSFASTAAAPQDVASPATAKELGAQADSVDRVVSSEDVALPSDARPVSAAAPVEMADTSGQGEPLPPVPSASSHDAAPAAPHRQTRALLGRMRQSLKK